MGKRRQSGGFLDRFFRPWKSQRVSLTQAGKKQAPMRKGKAAKKKAKKVKKTGPLSAKQRQVKELQTMFRIGKQDPERLAQIISSLLSDAMMQDQEDKMRFERLLWEKVENRGSDEKDSQNGSPKEE